MPLYELTFDDGTGHNAETLAFDSAVEADSKQEAIKKGRAQGYDPERFPSVYVEEVVGGYDPDKIWWKD